MGELVHRILEVITGMGYWGILIGLAIEVIPSEIVLAYAGYLAYQGEINMVEAVVFGTIGCLLQQIVLYAIGIYGGRPFVDKYGKYLHIKPKHIDLTERWFNKYGAGVVFTSRFIPVVRQAISIPAGIARMNLAKFLIYTGLASIPWAVLFITLGKKLGENWESIDEKAGPYTQPILWGALGLTVLYVLYKVIFRKKNPAPAADTDSPKGGETLAGRLNAIGSGYRVLHGRSISTTNASREFDHLVVGPNGVFHVEEKDWDGAVTFTAGGVERGNGGHKEDPTAQLYRQEFVLKELLRDNRIEADVTGVLCFSNPDCTLNGKSQAFAAVKPEQLADAIRSHQTKRGLTPEAVDRVARLLEESGSPIR